MSPRLALRFILLSLILAGLLMGAAVILNGRLRLSQPAASIPSLEQQLASMAMKLDADGIGSQVISGTHISVRLAPYPPMAGQPSTLSIVGSLPNGQLALITPTLYITSDAADAPIPQQLTPSRQPGGDYLAQAILFAKPGLWRTRIGFYLNPTDLSSVVLLVQAR